LYKYGGIYLDLKYSGQKSIDSFLKYDEFYFDVNEIVLSNSFIGSVKGNRHFRTMLEDFYRPKNLGIPQNVIFELTGGGKMIQAYTKK
jgi:mannosyltransferase OCH1-like enzyme